MISNIIMCQNLQEYLEKEGLHRYLLGVKIIEEGIVIYRQWSTQEELDKYNFMAIEMRIIDY
jgi:ASC-1-like (ASCH) protein